MIRNPEHFKAFLADVQQFVRDVAIPSEAQVEADDCIPESIVEEMRRRGYFGWSIPEQYGGAELTTEELALANIEISRCLVAFRARVGINTGIGSESLVQDGTPEQKDRYLPGLASGKLTGTLALTGAHAGSLQTAAELRLNGAYCLNGHKSYITLAPIADLFTVFARTQPAGRNADRVVQIFGGQGYVKERCIERSYRDVRAFRIYEGTSQIHQLNIAKHLLQANEPQLQPEQQ